jgi:predicted PurR-regulated permease PerM
MKRDFFLIAIFTLIAGLTLYLFYQVIVPFFVPIAWAAVLSIVFRPLYDRLLRRVRRPWLASVLMCALIVVLIIGPVTYLFVSLVGEATNAVETVNQLSADGKLKDLVNFDVPWAQEMRAQLEKYFDLSKINLEEIARDAVNTVSKVILNQTRWLITNGTKAVFYFFLMIFTLYYFFKDGERVVGKVRRLMPLSPSETEVTFSKLREVVMATMYGGVVVAFVQGALGGLMFWVFGLPSPVFWGAVMTFLSILPLVGAFIVYIPAGVILILTGSAAKGIAVLVIGTVVVSQIDNLLRPYLISGRSAMHPLLLFFAILGGIGLFGLLGVVMGPLIAALFLTILKVIEYKLHPETDPSGQFNGD